MGTAFYCIDIVDIRINLLRKTCVVLEGNLDRDDFIGFQTNRCLDEFFRPGIKIFDKLLQTIL